MLNSLKHLMDAKISATDGEVGAIQQACFDDRDWALRYLVVETGSWLAGRPVLISPYAVQQPVGHGNHLHLKLSLQQLRGSPPIDPQHPLSRQDERNYLRHFGYPAYWQGGALWGRQATPDGGMALAEAEEAEEGDAAALERQSQQVHLRASREVLGCEVMASDGSIGSVKDFVLDDDTWAIRYLVVDTSAWWQSGQRVLIGMPWAERIDFKTQQFHVHLNRAQVRASPKFEDVASIHRDYEERLHRNYERKGYWG